jgi:hypothetical protein
MDYKIYIAVAIILTIMLLYRYNENFEEPTDSDNWIRLYETFTLKPNPPDARWWEFKSNGRAYFKKDLKLTLKSYDIKVKRGRVQLWAIYPGETIASSSALGVSGYGDAYNDAMPLPKEKDDQILIGTLDDKKLYYKPPGWQHTYTTNAFRANNAKYKLIADARNGDRITGTLDYKCTRVMVIASFD